MLSYKLKNKYVYFLYNKLTITKFTLTQLLSTTSKNKPFKISGMILYIIR